MPKLKRNIGYKIRYTTGICCTIVLLLIGVIKFDEFEKNTKRETKKILQMKNSNEELIEEDIEIETIVNNVSTIEPKDSKEYNEKNKKENNEKEKEEINKKNIVENEKKVEMKATENTKKNAEFKKNEKEKIKENVEKKETMKVVEKKYYIVKEGDALVDISRQMYGTIKKVDIIKVANGLENENRIYIGQKLLIP